MNLKGLPVGNLSKLTKARSNSCELLFKPTEGPQEEVAVSLATDHYIKLHAEMSICTINVKITKNVPKGFSCRRRSFTLTLTKALFDNKAELQLELVKHSGTVRLTGNNSSFLMGLSDLLTIQIRKALETHPLA